MSYKKLNCHPFLMAHYLLTVSHQMLIKMATYKIPFRTFKTFGIKTILNLDQKNSKFTASQLFKELNKIRN